LTPVSGDRRLGEPVVGVLELEESVARVVQLTGIVRSCRRNLLVRPASVRLAGQEPESRLPGLLCHPQQCDVRQGLVSGAAPDFAVDPGEPDLLEVLRGRSLGILSPEGWFERGALLINREGVDRVCDQSAELGVVKAP
jgi:hypothetical protein